MKTIKNITLITILTLMTSCENIDVLDNNLPYTPLYVVSGQISGGDINPEISFTKSLPLNTEFDIKQAELKEVTAYIKTEDKKIMPLKYIKDGIYKPVEKFTVLPGGKYEIFALIEDTRVYGSTIAPPLPELLNVELTKGHISCEIMPEKDVVYCCVYVRVSGYLVGNPQIISRERDFFSVEGPFEENTGSIIIRTGTVPEEYLNTTAQERLGVEIYAWDKSYKKYFETKDNNKPIDDIFSQGGGSINWNVTGNNVIGMFIGFSTLVYDGEIK